MVYSFEQDALGRQTAVKVGSQTLSQSQYQNDPTKPNFGTLTATTYGNGAKISSRYDDFNRVTGVVYGEETAPRYEYDYNAKGQVARVRDNLLNRTTQSEYDLANRPVRVKTSEDAKHVYTGQVAYDNVYGNLSEFTEKVGENRQEHGTKFGYDDENRPTSLTYSASGVTNMTIDSIRSCLKDHSSVVFRYNSEYYSLRKKNLLSRTVYILVGTDMIHQQRDSLEKLCDQVYISDGIRLSAAFAEIEIPEWNDPAWESYEAVRHQVIVYHQEIHFCYQSKYYWIAYAHDGQTYLSDEQGNTQSFLSARALFENARIDGYLLKDIWEKVTVDAC